MISNEVLEELKDTIHPSVVIERALASDLLQTRADLAAAREDMERYRWIPVGERFPEIYKPVLVLNTAGMSFVLHLTSENQWVDHEDTLYWHITHWMPLPLPPKEGE